MNVVVFSGALLIAAMFFVSSYFRTKGNILILEDPKRSGFTAEFIDYNDKNKCEMILREGDIVQVEIGCNEGAVALTIGGKKGSEPYAGKDLDTAVFTVTVSETDTYVFWISGQKATGSIHVKKR